MSRNSQGIRRVSTLPVRFAGSGANDGAFRNHARTQSPAQGIPSIDSDDSTDERLGAKLAHLALEQRKIRERSKRSRRDEESSSPSRRRTRVRSRNRRRRATSTESEEIIIHSDDARIDKGPIVYDVSDSSYSSRPRSRLHSHRVRLRPNYAAESSDESNENGSDDETYNFVLPSRNTSFISQDSTIAAISTKERSEDYASDPLAGTKVPDNAYNIIEARYSGQGSVGGQHQAELTVIEELRKHKSSLYRWIHFSDQNIDKFKNAVLGLPGLSDAERSAVSRLLGRVRRPLDTSLRTTKSSGARRLQPGCDKEEVQTSSGFQQQKEKSQTITWMCVPYFSLDRYTSNASKSAQSTESQSVRTLLQGHSSSVFEDRDLQQAVCKLAGGKAGHCYYVPQVWYLVIGDSMLVTCAKVSIEDLRAGGVSLTKIPPPVTPSMESQKVLVKYGVSLLWSFNLSGCLTWFNLISQFAEFWPERISLLFSGKLLTSELWLRLVNRAKHTNENIKLSLQRSGRDRPRLRGILSDRANFTFTFHDDTKQHVDADESMPQESNQMRKTQTEARPANAVSSSVYLDNLFVFSWLSERDGQNMSENQVREDLEAIDMFLKKSTDLGDRSVYTTCSSLAWDDVVRPLRSQADTLRTSSGSTESEAEKKRRSLHSVKVDVYNAAESLFEFFLPLTTKGPTIDRFWGALGSLLESIDKGESGEVRSSRRKHRQTIRYAESDLREICTELDNLLLIAKPFQDLFSHATMEDRAGITLPNELAKVWLHVVMALTYASKHNDLWMEHLESAEKLLRLGTKKVVRSVKKRSILQNSVVMPHEIANLVNLGLLHDKCSIEEIESGPITQTYWRYLGKLQSDMLGNPLFRGHQDNILLLKQEIAVILETLAAQQKIFIQSDLYNDQNRSHTQTYNRMRVEQSNFFQLRSRSHGVNEPTIVKPHDQSYYHQHSMVPPPPDANIAVAGGVINNDLSPTDPGGYRDLLIQECLELLRRKIADFEEMNEKATDLETWNIRRIETNKDRQDVAIYTFTVVTIIFLPLSTVAGILGMNTYDVRNMEQRQWVFWTVAIPLLLIVIFLCLVWTGEWDNFWTGFKTLFRKNDSQNTKRSKVLGDHRTGDWPPPLPLVVSPEHPQREQSRYQFDDKGNYYTDLAVNTGFPERARTYIQAPIVRPHSQYYHRPSFARRPSR